MKRLIMIFVLALWLPLGVGFAAPEEYDGSQDPETAFFDGIIDEHGNLLVNKDNKDISYEAIRAIEQMNEERFGCIKTEFIAPRIRPPSYQLNAYFSSLLSSPSSTYWLGEFGYYDSLEYKVEDRYIMFHGCLVRRFCLNSSHYLIDAVGKHIAIVTKLPFDIFNKEIDENGKLIDDYDNFHRAIFLLPDTPEYFIQKALELSEKLNYEAYRNPKIFFIDCRKSDKIESKVAIDNPFSIPRWELDSQK